MQERPAIIIEERDFPLETTVLWKSDIPLTRERMERLSTTYGLSKRTLKKYWKNKRAPLRILLDLCHEERKSLNELVGTKNILMKIRHEIIIPEYIDEKLAYLVGYLQADDCIESDKKRISFVDEYLCQMRQIRKISRRLFNDAGTIRSRICSKSQKPMYMLEIGNKILNSLIHNYFGINRGVKENLRIPLSIRPHKELLRWYLKGLYDGDGTLPKDPAACKQLFIDITLKDKDIIEDIKRVLEKQFCIRTLKLYKRVARSPHSDAISETWELRIRKRSEIRRFLNEIGFFHPEKRRRMLRMMDQ